MKIGLALSGGGFRASAFHLGVLKRLEELNVLSNLETLSSVSGGAITGALYAHLCVKEGDGSPGSYSVDKLIEEMTPGLQSNLRGRALFSTPSKALTTLGSFFIPFIMRMPLVVNELDRTFYHGAYLDNMPDWICINATNLRTGKNWKFYNNVAGDQGMGAVEYTETIRLAEAVGASAAYPGLVDYYPFRTRWENLKPGLISEYRWSRKDSEGKPSSWRRRFGKGSGSVKVPLVDGGIYDNEGVNSLRSANVTHAIVSCAAPRDGDFVSDSKLRYLMQVVGVMHTRLGNVTRQWAFEATHKSHPTHVRVRLQELAKEVRGNSDWKGAEKVATELEELANVGWPPRVRQFSSTAQVLLHLDDVARNKSAEYDEDPYDIPERYRGLSIDLVDEISRIRTDLDALEPDVFEYLLSQGYFLADAYMKISMPEVVAKCTGTSDPKGSDLYPEWERAHQAVSKAHGDEGSGSVLKKASKKKLPLGRCKDSAELRTLLPGLGTFTGALLLLLVAVSLIVSKVADTFAVHVFWTALLLISLSMFIQILLGQRNRAKDVEGEKELSGKG